MFEIRQINNSLNLTLKVAMRPEAPYFIILLCLTPHNFTRPGESAANQWVNTSL